MTRRIVKETLGTVKVINGELHISNDHELISVVVLSKGQGHQLIHEINDWLRYPKC